MEPANHSPVTGTKKTSGQQAAWQVAFLPDPDELEKKQLPAGLTTTLYLLLAMLAAAVLWATLFEIDTVVSARGKLVTSQPNIVIQSFETAQITALNVRAGQVVKKGQVLAVLDPTFVTADLAQAQDKLKSLDAEMRRLDQEQAGNAYGGSSKNRDEALQSSLQAERLASFQARMQRLDEGIGRLKAILATNESDITAQEARMKSLLEIEAMNEELTRQNFQSKLRLLESRERRQEVEREMMSTRNRTHELKKQLSEAEAEKVSFSKEWRQKSTEELVAVRRERNTVAEQVNKAERRSRLIELVAPADAVVLEVAAKSTGSVMRESEQLFVLVPLGVALEAEIQIDSQDIGFVKLTDPVRLKIDAFPFQKHGLIKSRLDKLGQDAFTRDAGSGVARTAFYVGRTQVNGSELRKLPEQTQLIPGMTLTAEVVVGKRSVISYLMYPVLGGLSEAGTER
jgi:HlyD family secretion protein